MNTRFETPAPLRAEHQELHDQLVAATREAGPLGEAARELAHVLHPHFVNEEAFALPPLALLVPLARGERPDGMEDVLALTRRLKAEWPTMLAEHQQIGAALERLRAAARAAGRAEYVRFADALALHARTEEAVLYPAAILVGELVGSGMR